MLLVLVQGNCPVGLRHRQPGEIRGLAPRVEDRVKDFLHDRLLAGLYFQEGRTAQSSCRYPRPPGCWPGWAAISQTAETGRGRPEQLGPSCCGPRSRARYGAPGVPPRVSRPVPISPSDRGCRIPRGCMTFAGMEQLTEVGDPGPAGTGP